MNFFGHAAIAGRFEPDPVFVLGAMLPDFCNMLGFTAHTPRSGKLAAGVRFHHVTDHAFHELDAFRSLNREATALLDARGVRRGTARAVAHVGVELMLDAELAESDQARTLYLEALRSAAIPDIFCDAPWSPAERAELGRLAATLEARGVAKTPTTHVFVERLTRALARRPRLMITSADLPAVTDWVELFRARVVACALTLVSELTLEIERRLAA